MRIRFLHRVVRGWPVSGPQVWPWWLLISFRICRLDVAKPSSGYRLWVYTRWRAPYFDIVFDRTQNSGAK